MYHFEINYSKHFLQGTFAGSVMPCSFRTTDYETALLWKEAFDTNNDGSKRDLSGYAYYVSNVNIVPLVPPQLAMAAGA